MSAETKPQLDYVALEQDVDEDWSHFVKRLKKRKTPTHFRAYGGSDFLYDPNNRKRPVELIRSDFNFGDDKIEAVVAASLIFLSRWQTLWLEVPEIVQVFLPVQMKPESVQKPAFQHSPEWLAMIESVPLVSPESDFTDEMEHQGDRNWLDFVSAVVDRARTEKKVEFICYAQSIFEFDIENMSLVMLKRGTWFNPFDVSKMILNDFKKVLHIEPGAKRF